MNSPAAARRSPMRVLPSRAAMESLALPPSLAGEECQQLGELNRRLGAYLGRVQSLEGEHSRLRAELAGLREAQRGQPAWRTRCQEEVAALRARLEGASLEAQRAALALEALREEARGLRGRCLREREAREAAARELQAGRGALEGELRAQLGLRARGAQLEGEREALREAHREQREALQAQLQRGVSAPQPPRPPAPQPPELEGYARRLEGLWRGALQGYRAQVARLEDALERARDRLRAASEDGRQGRLRLQQLHRELAGLHARKEALQDGLARLQQRRQGGAHELQLAIEELEEEKEALKTQIAQILEDRQQLMQLKMSLSLEVATYRSLLEAESTRLQVPTMEYKMISSLWDSKLEANPNKLQDLTLSPFPKPQPAKNQQDTPVVSLASVLPQGSSPEFQRADPALQSPLMNGFDEVLPDQEALSFVAETPQVEAASSISFHEFGSISPVATSPMKEESFLGLEQELQEDGGEATSPMEEPSEEPPGDALILSMPYPTQIVTEALEIALQEVNREDPQLGSSLLHVPETPNGIPLSGEEENGAPLPTTVGLEEEAAPEQLKKVPPEGYHLTGHLEDVGEAVVVNGDQEAFAGDQDLGTEVGVSQGADLALPQETGLPEERGLFAAESQEDLLGNAPSSGEMDSGEEVASLENQAPEEEEEQASALQGGGQASELEISERADPAALLGQAASILPWDGEESREPGPSYLPYEEQLQVPGGDLEESDGGVEDLEVMSTEALHLSEEDEERRDLWSPSQDNETGDLQAEGLAEEQTPPTRCQALSAESQPEPLFFGLEQEVPQCKPNSASPQEEVVELPAVSEEEAVLRDGGPVGAEEPGSPGSTDDAEGPGEGIWGARDSHVDERVLDGKDGVEKERISNEEVVCALEGTWGSDSVPQPEDIPELEASEGGQKEDPREVPEGDLSLQQKTEEEGEVGVDGGFPNEEWVTNAGATGTESGEEAEDRMGSDGIEGWQEQESPLGHAAPKPELGTEASPAEEQQDAEEMEDDDAVCSQDPVALMQSVVCEPDAATEVTSEGQRDASEPQDEGQGCPQAPTEALPVGSLQSPSNDSASESVDTSPNASHDTDWIEQDLEHGRPIVLEDTLPDHTPLHMYDGRVAAVAGEERSLSENEGAVDLSLLAEDGSALVQDVPPVVEQEDKCSPQTEESAVGAVHGAGGAGEEGGCGDESAPSQALPSTELPIPRDFEEGTAELGGDDGALPMIDPEMPRELEVEHSQELGELPKTGSEAKQEPEAGEPAAVGVDVAGEPEDSVFQAGELDLIPDGTWEEKDTPLDGWQPPDAGSQEAEGASKVSPLTSVADLGEIVLEGEVQKESLEVVFNQGEEEGLLPIHETLPISDLESCQGDGATQVRDPTGEEPSGNEAGSPDATMSVLEDGMKDILELVEQALEFNQEVIKAGQGMEMEQPVPEGGAHNAPEEEEGLPVSATLPSMEESQSFTDPSQASSPRAKDPPETTQSWTESATNGLPPDPPSPEILNGVGEFTPPNVAMEDGLSQEEPAKKVTFTQQCLEEEMAELSSLSTLATSPPTSEKALRPGEGDPEEVAVSHEGLEVPGADTLKGKGAELEGVSLSAHFGEEILCLESGQPLKYQPEDRPELWFAEGN